MLSLGARALSSQVRSKGLRVDTAPLHVLPAATHWVMALAGQFRTRPQDLAHLSLPPEVPVESSKCYSAAHSIFTSASMAGSDCHFQIITISRTQLQDLFIGIISAAIFTLKWKGLVLWTGGNFTLLTHLRIFLFGCALCGYISIWMTLMFFRQ